MLTRRRQHDWSPSKWTSLRKRNNGNNKNEKNSPQRQFRDFRKEDSWLQPERMGVIYKLVQVNYGSTFMKHDPCIWALPVFFWGRGIKGYLGHVQTRGHYPKRGYQMPKTGVK